MFRLLRKPKIEKGVLIATLESVDNGAGMLAEFCLGIGFVAMVLEILFDENAIRIAAWGAIWTGWNVLCGIGILTRRRFDYVVYREISPE